MATPRFNKRYWLILVGFALIGIGLGVALTATGLFVPFGITIVGLMGAAALVCLASLGVALLLMASIKIVKSLNQTSVPIESAAKPAQPKIEDTPGAPAIRGVQAVLPSSNPNIDATFSSPMQTTAPPQPVPDGEQAEAVKNYLIRLFSKKGELYEDVVFGSRANTFTLEEALNGTRGAAYFSYQTMDGKGVPIYRVQLEHADFKYPNEKDALFSTEQAQEDAMKAKLFKGWHEIDSKPQDKTGLHGCPGLLSVFANKINKKWGEGTAKIISVRHQSHPDYEESYYYTYSVEISLVDIKRIFPTIPSPPGPVLEPKRQ